MKKTLVYLSLFIPSLFLVGCEPDLTVTRLDTQWDAHNKKALVQIKNQGMKDAGPFLVYINGEEDPVSQNHRPQLVEHVRGLAQNGVYDFTADFAPLAHPYNANLNNVKKIVVIVDPKGQVSESDENNNTKQKDVP
jgi:hypothetical protein